MRLIPPAFLSLVFATACLGQGSPESAAASPAPSSGNTATLSSGPGQTNQSRARAEPAAPAPAVAIPPAQEPGSESAPAALKGSLANGRYYSPTRSFDIAIPTLFGDRPAILDNAEIVVFRDDVRTMLTIAAIRMTSFDKWELETSSPRDFLIKFFRENVLADYAESFPGTAVESARLVPDLEGGALMVNTLHPNGSAFQVDPIVRNDPSTPVPIAKRGNLLFQHGDFVYVISSELADRVTELSTYTTDTETEDKILRDRLIDVHEQMHFDNPDAPAAPTTTASNSPKP